MTPFRPDPPPLGYTDSLIDTSHDPRLALAMHYIASRNGDSSRPTHSPSDTQDTQSNSAFNPLGARPPLTRRRHTVAVSAPDLAQPAGDAFDDMHIIGPAPYQSSTVDGESFRASSRFPLARPLRHDNRQIGSSDRIPLSRPSSGGPSMSDRMSGASNDDSRPATAEGASRPDSAMSSSTGSVDQSSIYGPHRHQFIGHGAPTPPGRSSPSLSLRRSASLSTQSSGEVSRPRPAFVPERRLSSWRPDRTATLLGVVRMRPWQRQSGQHLPSSTRADVGPRSAQDSRGADEMSVTSEDSSSAN